MDMAAYDCNIIYIYIYKNNLHSIFHVDMASIETYNMTLLTVLQLGLEELTLTIFRHCKILILLLFPLRFFLNNLQVSFFR